MIFDARSLASVRAERRPLANLALFLLQNEPNVCVRTLPIPPWHPNSLLYAGCRRPICVRRPSKRPPTTGARLQARAAASFAKESPETAEQPQTFAAIVNGIVLPTCAPRGRHSRSRSPGFCPATRRLTAVLLSAMLSQCGGGNNAAAAAAAAAAAFRRRSRSSKFSRACGAPIFSRACGAPRRRSAARRCAVGAFFCIFPYGRHVVAGVKT